MYNLIVGSSRDTSPADRMLEYTDDVLLRYLRPDGALDRSRLLTLPTLFMPEIADPDSVQIAQVGHVQELARVGPNFRFRFVPGSLITPLPTSAINELAVDLQIADWEFRRTHWAVKDVDLFRVLGAYGASVPTVFKFPLDAAREELVAVMMPFDASFSPVHTALQKAVSATGLKCERVDDIWINDAIIEDVASLIWRARIVISDLTGKNPNVFYETGIAHALGREVILITQQAADVPFDLRHLRYVSYHSNGEGLDKLQQTITDRIGQLANSR